MPRRNDPDPTSDTSHNVTKTVPVVLLLSLDPAKRTEYAKMDNFALNLTITPPSLAPELRAQYQVVPDDDITGPDEDAQDSPQDEPDEPAEPSTSPEASDVDSMQDEYQQSAPSKRRRVTKEDQEYKSFAKAKGRRILTRSEGRQAQARASLIEEFEKRYAELPFELKTIICAAFATKPGERRLYIDAFFLHKGYNAMRLPLLETIATTEVVLRGTEHEAQFAAFHPVVVERAKFLKLVYEIKEAPYTPEQHADRAAAIARQTADKGKGLKHIHIQDPLPAYQRIRGPPEDFSYCGNERNDAFYHNLRSMLSLTELVIDLRFIIQYHHDYGFPFEYSTLVVNALQTACGYGTGMAIPNDHPLKNPIAHSPGCHIRKLTLLLPPVEIAKDAACSRDWVHEWRALLQVGQGMVLPQNDIQIRQAATLLRSSVPEYEQLRGVLRMKQRWLEYAVSVGMNVAPLQLPNLTEFELDVAGGKVVYKEVGYEG